jgi:multidrug efflux pump subunit AcrA (membrane-fusion protein)
MAISEFNNPFSLLKAKPNNIDDPIINISPINEQKKLEEEERARAEKSMKLKNFADTLRMVNANQSGNYQQSMMFANRLAQRKAEQEARQKEAQALMKKEQFERDQELFIKQNPELAGAIRMNQLFGMDMPKPAKRDSYVAKDGYRYYVDGNQERVYPNVTVTEEQTQADIYKEEVANIKRIVMNEGIESPKLTQQQKDFYNNDLNNQGVLSLDQALASMLVNNNTNNTNDSINSNTSNENIVQDNKTYVYSRTQEDGSKVYVNGGKEYVFQD